MEVRKLQEGNEAETRERFMEIKGGKGYTIADIEALPEGERAELIDGEMFRMDAPSWTHQEILVKLLFEIELYIRENKGKCKVMPAPFAVYIKKDNRNYVEPDISVICDADKKSKKGCQGAPDWVIEILSPSSVEMDCERKVKLYHEAGVREYWIVDPEKETVTVYDFQHRKTTQKTKETHDSGHSGAPMEAGTCALAAEPSATAGGSGHGTDKATADNFMPAHHTFSERVKAGIFEELWLDFSEMDLS